MAAACCKPVLNARIKYSSASASPGLPCAEMTAAGPWTPHLKPHPRPRRTDPAAQLWEEWAGGCGDGQLKHGPQDTAPGVMAPTAPALQLGDEGRLPPWWPVPRRTLPPSTPSGLCCDGNWLPPMPGTVPGSCVTTSQHLPLLPACLSRHCPQLADDKTEAQSREALCPGPQMVSSRAFWSQSLTVTPPPPRGRLYT